MKDLQQWNEDKRADIQSRRTALIAKTTTLLGMYHLAISLIVRILEQSKHGSVARHIKMKADYLNTAMRMMDLESKEKGVRGSKMVYTDEVDRALENYKQYMRDGMERLRERKGDAERILWGYGIGRNGVEKEKVMREIARVYGELRRELKAVGKDIARLEEK